MTIVSVIPENVWKEMGAPQLTKPQVCLTSPGGELICLGEFMANTTSKAVQLSEKSNILRLTMSTN